METDHTYWKVRQVELILTDMVACASFGSSLTNFQRDSLESFLSDLKKAGWIHKHHYHSEQEMGEFRAKNIIKVYGEHTSEPKERSIFPHMLHGLEEYTMHAWDDLSRVMRNSARRLNYLSAVEQSPDTFITAQIVTEELEVAGWHYYQQQTAYELVSAYCHLAVECAVFFPMMAFAAGIIYCCEAVNAVSCRLKNLRSY